MVVQNRVDCLSCVVREFNSEWFAGIRIWFKKLTSGAQNGDANLVSRVENLAQPAHMKLQAMDFAWDK